MNDCLFCKIIAGELPGDIVFQNDDVVAFRDINPQAPTHLLIVPRRHIPTLNELTEADAGLIGRLNLAATELAAREGIADDGYRIVMNCNEGAGQTVWHIHMHLLGGRGLSWPPG
ncbi:MAG TPA: histidine triad nucleotide-binding protein [Gammaproteobacteria bacterium]|nr:histidine triad nucleotide-binding protein [Gammaproteobacteria bacterium]